MQVDVVLVDTDFNKLNVRTVLAQLLKRRPELECPRFSYQVLC